MSQTEIIEFLEKKQGYFTSGEIAENLKLSISSTTKPLIQLSITKETTIKKRKGLFTVKTQEFLKKIRKRIRAFHLNHPNLDEILILRKIFKNLEK